MSDNKELVELQFRRALCRGIIRFLYDLDDPRRFDAIVEYNRQLVEIDKKIQNITGIIPPVIIGLKTAQLFAKSERS